MSRRTNIVEARLGGWLLPLIRASGILTVLTLIFCSSSYKDPCEDTLTWRFDEEPSGLVYDAWLGALQMWGEVGVRFAESPAPDGKYVVGIDNTLRARTGRVGQYQVKNGVLTITVDPSSSSLNFIRLRGVFAHEIGHSFGLAHVPSPGEPGGRDSIMNTYRWLEFETLPEGDIAYAQTRCD